MPCGVSVRPDCLEDDVSQEIYLLVDNENELSNSSGSFLETLGTYKYIERQSKNITIQNILKEQVECYHINRK